MHDHVHPHPHISSPGSYSGQVRKVLVTVLALNWGVALLKLAFGYFIASTSMIADGYHSFADGASNIIGLLGIRIACQPKDKEHPYGHKKYETLAALAIAFLIFLVCAHILHSGWERLLYRKYPEVNLTGFIVLGLTMAVNIFVLLYEYRAGKRLGSDILVADSMHTRADLFTSFSVVIAFIGVRLGFPILDAVVAVFIAGFIAFAGFDIIRASSAVLCDTAVMDVRAVEELVLSLPDVKKCHNIRTRGRPDDIYMDLHVLVDDLMPLVKAHDLTVQIEDLIKDEFHGVSDVVVHVEPLSSETHHG